MKYFPKIVGENIYLSPMNVDDAEIYVRWLNDFKVTDGTGSSTRVLNLKAEQEWIANALSSGAYQFAIVRLSDDKLLGNCGIESMRTPSMNAEVGLFIGDSENRERGYGTEALQLLLSYGFFYLNLNNIMLKVFSFNERAIHVYEKVGFKEIGRRRKSYYLNGAYYDDVFMDILKEEFPKSYIQNAYIK